MVKKGHKRHKLENLIANSLFHCQILYSSGIFLHSATSIFIEGRLLLILQHKK